MSRPSSPVRAIPRSWRPTGWPAAIALSLAVAAVSIPLARDTIAYDPYSWAIWGREIAHLHLDTRDSATAVKPLPMLFDTVFAFLGSHLPAWWLYAARVGGVLTIVAVFRLARRLGGLAAAVIAAAGVAVSDQFLGYLFMRGMSEPWAAAAVVAATDCFLLGRRRTTLFCLAAAACLRPEAWPLLAAAAVYFTWRTAWSRRVIAWAVAILVPLSWFVIDWIGSGELNRSERVAIIPTGGGPLLHRYPGVATLTETWRLASGPVVVLFLVGLAACVASWWRSGHPLSPAKLSAPATVAAVALAWVLINAALAQAHLSPGSPRYLLPGDALACVVAGWVVTAAAQLARSRRSNASPAYRWLPASFACVALIALVPSLIDAGQQWRSGIEDGRQYIALSQHLTAAITRSGGAQAIDACAPISTRNYDKPLVAWALGTPLQRVSTGPAPSGTVLQQARKPWVPDRKTTGFHVVADVPGSPMSSWRVLSTCVSGRSSQLRY